MLKSLLTASVVVPMAAIGARAASASPGGHGGSPRSDLQLTTVLDGHGLTHSFASSSGGSMTAALSGPDDLTFLGRELFVVFQNGVGPQAKRPETGTPLAPSSASPATAGCAASGMSLVTPMG